MYSAYKLNKQGDNIQPWHTSFPILNQSIVPCPVLTVDSWSAYRRQVRWSGIPNLFKNFPQFVVIHSSKAWCHQQSRSGCFFEFSWFFFFNIHLFNWKLITLQYCSGFAIYWHESTMGVHVFPILNPPPCTILLGHPSAPAPSILHRTWTGDSFHIWYYTCFNAILPNYPTLALSHRVQKTVLYIYVSFAVSHTGLS